jgi:hypothetical protein
MDLLLALALGVTGIGGALFITVFVYAALVRMRGGRTRFDPYIEAIVRGQSASVFPHSLRPGLDVPVIESQEVARGARASSEAPGSELGDAEGPRPGSPRTG